MLRAGENTGYTLQQNLAVPVSCFRNQAILDSAKGGKVMKHPLRT